MVAHGFRNLYTSPLEQLLNHLFIEEPGPVIFDEMSFVLFFQARKADDNHPPNSMSESRGLMAYQNDLSRGKLARIISMLLDNRMATLVQRNKRELFRQFEKTIHD